MSHDNWTSNAAEAATAVAGAGATAVRRWTINRVREDDGLVGMYEASSARFRDGEKFVHVETKFVLASDHDAVVATLEAREASRTARIAELDATVAAERALSNRREVEREEALDAAERYRTAVAWHVEQEAMARLALAQAEARVAALEDALERLDQWARAYPLDVFPEPHFPTVNEVLNAAGLSLGAVSASNMRHVINGVKAIVSAALSQGGAKGEGK